MAQKFTGYVFRTSMTLKDGTKIYAKDYGKKAFKIPLNIRKK